MTAHQESTQGMRDGYTMTCDDRKHEPTRKSNFSALSPPGHAIELRNFLLESVEGVHFSEDVVLRFG